MRLPLFILAGAIFFGCAAGPDTLNWQSRIGRFSLDDAKRELGPPESCVGLENEGTACSWTRFKSKDQIEKLVLTFHSNGVLATASDVHFD
ncbi:MAG TPA: hypothetical protein VFS39_17435 [Nitrospira sp.]|nr:hypothetical protein [Nitrospira sp.]